MRDSFITLEQLYSQLPGPLQSLALNIIGWRTRRRRFNRDFSRLFDEYVARTKWTAERIRSYRDQRLFELLCWAEDRSPFYAERFRRAEFSPSKQGDFEGFDRVPVLDRAEVQEHVSRIRIDVDEPTTLVHTSGTTGGGLRFPCTMSAQREQWACWQRYRSWHGIGLNEPCAYFGGRLIVPIGRRKPPYWRKSWMSAQLIFSAYHLSPDTAHSYIAELERSRIRWIHGYPSFVSLLASYIAERSERVEMHWVTLGAENVTPAQEAVIEAAFGVKPLQHYGMAEAVANFSQWPDGVMRVDEDFAYTEFLPRPDGLYDVVGTNFTNWAFPLIRYRVGDIAELPTETVNQVQFGRTVREVDGRMEDYVVTKDGAQLGRLDHIFKHCVNIREAQIVQKQVGEVKVNIVPNARYSAEDERLLEREVRQRFGSRVDFQICRIDSIERTLRGKLRLVVSELTKPASRE